ncbi:MAG: shikimate dehydrogenase family protein [Oligoflexus sp.]
MDLKVNGSTRLIALIGRPLSHSKSPLIHNFSIQSLGLNQIYVPLELELSSAAETKDFLAWAWRLGFVGMNVTLPYKEYFAEALQSPLKSINTVYRKGDAWAAASTDGPGFLRGLRHMSSTEAFDRMIILGNGGAAVALAQYALQNDLCRSCHVLRRSAEKDQHWFAHIDKNRLSFYQFEPQDLSQILAMGVHGPSLVVQATSAPLRGDNLEHFARELEVFDGAFVDITYGHDSALLTRASKLGIPCQDGLPMLIEQARESQRLWWGQSASYEELSQLVASHT